VTEHYVQSQLPADGGFFTAMANLATTTSADLETVATLTKAIVKLMHQLSAKYKLAKSKEAEIKRLLCGRAPAMSDVIARPAAAYVRKSYNTKNDNYCCSHCYQFGMAHKSANCTKKSPGHKDEATKDNIMGGATLGVVSSSDEVGTFR
jgi:hypothetical protein